MKYINIKLKHQCKTTIPDCKQNIKTKSHEKPDITYPKNGQQRDKAR